MRRHAEGDLRGALPSPAEEAEAARQAVVEAHERYSQAVAVGGPESACARRAGLVLDAALNAWTRADARAAVAA